MGSHHSTRRIKPIPREMTSVTRDSPPDPDNTRERDTVYESMPTSKVIRSNWCSAKCNRYSSEWSILDDESDALRI